MRNGKRDTSRKRRAVLSSICLWNYHEGVKSGFMFLEEDNLFKLEVSRAACNDFIKFDVSPSEEKLVLHL